jgi:hypothetical protein
MAGKRGGGTAVLRPGRTSWWRRVLFWRRVPAGSGRGRGGPPGRFDDGGGAGVREPRRPHPTAPAGAAAREPGDG